MNGVELLQESDFNQNVEVIQLDVNVLAQNAIAVELRSKPGGRLTVNIVGEDILAPTVQWDTPLQDEFTIEDLIAASLSLADDISGLDPASLSILLDGVSVTEAFSPLSTPTLTAVLSADLPMEVGPHTLTAEVSDLAGNSGTATVSFTIIPPIPPAADLGSHTMLTSSPTITIGGMVMGGAQVEVSSPLGTFLVLVTNDAFTAEVPLALNSINHLFFTVINADGVRGPPISTIVTQDSQPPNLFIDFPADGTEVTTATVGVGGRVGDLLAGFMGLTVTVNGVEADVNVGIGNNGTFFASNIPLALGPNQISATAVDELGNTRISQTMVARVDIPADAPRMVITSGNRQTGTVNSVLPLPLVVLVSHPDGSPFVGKLVTFDVTRSNGRLTADGTGEGQMMMQVRVDVNGEARAFLQLGSDAGSGNNRVAVTSRDIAGTVLFCASATAGPATQINIGAGNNQRAEVGGPVPELLSVWVSDACNGVLGVPVMFIIRRGGGKVNGQDMVIVATDRTGHAEVAFTLGHDPGNNEVEANIVGSGGPGAFFILHGVARGENTPTSFSGLVLDNGNRPVQGAGCSLTIGSSAPLMTTTDASGQFRFDNLSGAGPAKLHVDGLVATAIDGASILPGSLPSLDFEVIIVPNAANSLPTPVLLPPLDPNNAVTFDNTQDVVLTVEGMEGLSMLVKAGSMTRADGTVPSPADPAIIALNQVHTDDVPMPMPDGAAPPFAWTLQPAGAMFDPPIQITYPNMSGLPAGSIAYFLSFNHDTGKFEIIATGQVTDDGLSIISDPGSGIVVSGWGCNCPPYSVAGDCEGGEEDDRDDTDEDEEKTTQEQPPGTPSSNPDCPKKEGDGDIDPVYLFSGEFYEKVVDLRIKGRELDFIWERKYTSNRGVSSIQGNGWDCSYNIFIEPAGGDILVCDGNARRDVYRDQGDGTFTKRGFFRVLLENPDGTFTLDFPDKGQWVFNGFDGSPAAGRISRIIDRNGNTLSFAYDAQSRLATVTDTLDRDINFAYNADGFVESVTDFQNRQVRYEYYQDGDAGGSFGDLESATTPTVVGTPNGNDFPSGKTTVYTYTTGFADERLNHDLLTITDAKGQLYLRNTYAHTIDAADPRHTTDPNDFNFDRIVRQAWGNPDDIIDLVYLPQEPSPANNNATIRTILNDRVGNVTEYFYDDRNRGVLERVFTGRADPDLATTETDNRPTGQLRANDPPFFETKYFWNRDSKQTRIKYPNGNVVANIYEDDINSNAPPRTRGNLRMRIRIPGTHTPGGDQATIVEEFRYDTDFNSCCGFNYVTEYVDGRGNTTTHQYDDRGNRIRTQERIASIVNDSEYNQFGQITAQVWPDNGSNHRRRDEYTYYSAGSQRGYLEKEIVDETGFALTIVYEYDLVGNVLRKTDPRGRDAIYAVNELDQIVREVSRDVANGSSIRYQKDFFYDGNNKIVRIDIQNVDKQGVVQANSHFSTIYEFEILDHVTRKCEEVGSYTGTIPGTAQHPLCTGLPESEFLTTEYAYDANRNQTLVRYGEAVEDRQSNNIVQMLYDERDLLFKEIRAPGDPDRSTSQYDYDRNKNLRVVRQGIEDQPRIMTYVYDGYDRRIVDLDPMRNLTIYNYDANSNIVRETHKGELEDMPVTGLGGADVCAFFFSGPIQLCDPVPDNNVRLQETVYVYDAIDRRIRQEEQFFDTETQTPIDDGASITQTFYSDNSQVVRVVNDNNHETLAAYDTANRKSVITDAKSNTIAYAYDRNNNVITVTEVEKSDLGTPDETFVTTYAFDGIDRLVSMTDNVGNVTQYEYDSRNNRSRTIDAKGNVVRYVYDGINRLTQTIRELRNTGDGTGTLVGNISTTQTWDDSSRLTAQTDDNGNGTNYVYDPLNRIAAEQYADNTVHTYAYDVHDNRVATTDANGSVTSSTYDLLNRQARTDIVPGPGVSNDTTFEVFKYDGLSRLIHIQDDDSLVTHSYNSRNDTTRETLNGQTTTNVYDGVGNLLQCTYPGGRVVTCTFDELERKKVISDQSGTIATYSYVGPNRVTRREYGNGTRTSYTYDGIAGIPNPTNDFGVKKIIRTTHTRISDSSVIDDRTFTWDKLYNKTQRKDVRAGGPQLTHDYSYDSIYRLIRSDRTPLGGVPETTDYALDGVGNRTTVTGGSHSGTYVMDATTPDPADSQLNQYTTTSLDARQYDKNGNLNTIDAGQPTARTVGYDYRNRMVQHADSDAGTTATYRYDALGRRIERTVDAGSSETTRYFYSDIWRVCEEQDETNATHATYIYGVDIDEVLNMRRGGTDAYYHCDDLENVLKVTDGSAVVAESYDYGDYGEPLDADTLAPIAESTVGNPYLFTGRRFDPETAWYYFRTRYLDPFVGRFTTRDTIGMWGDPLNLGNGYSYASSNPWTYTDPYGDDALEMAGGITVGLGEGAWDFVGGLGELAWDLLWHPIDTTTGIVGGIEGLINTLTEEGLGEAFKDAFPKFGKLADCWDQLSDYEKGKLIGGLIGEEGAGILTGAGAIKLAKKLAALKKLKKLQTLQKLIPNKAKDVLKHIKKKKSPPQGYKGGKTFNNRDGKLPKGGKYKEYDIDPKVKGKPRGAGRIVVDEATGQAWYTPDHYDTFIPITD